MNYKIVEVNKNEIVAGDTILYDGDMKTVCKSNISYDKFMGLAIFGNTFKLGYEKVKKVLIIKAND